MNLHEVHHSGWLVKSPPTKRIWRARWRRRWFTLKQGEIPEQFCLEYYTDRNCRKLKGVIDLDQCEQVDCGLRLENRKQKFQFMFDIKTPKRTYYLAADTEADMRDWVNCICQVCHLHDTKQSNELQDDTRSLPPVTTVSSTSTLNSLKSTSSTSVSALASTSASTSTSLGQANSTTNATTTTSFLGSTLPSSSNSSSGSNSVAATNNSAPNSSFNSSQEILRRAGVAQAVAGVIDQQPLAQHNNYPNNSDSAYVNTDYTNRETLLCDQHFDQQQLLAAAQEPPPPSPGTVHYLNTTFLQTQAAAAAAAAAVETARRLAVNSNGVVRKIPKNLVLNNTPLPEESRHSVQASPALSTASGPYIPISECFSGSPKFLVDGNNPTTPLNNLDPKFYDTPRSHNNIGLNLTNDQSYSPKITNCSLQQQINNSKNRSHRSDSDSESVFTDDDEWTHPLPLRENVDRSTRPSDSSIENESFVLTYSQRFSKLPDEVSTKEPKSQRSSASGSTTPGATSAATTTPAQGHTLEKLAKVLKNKNNLILDIDEHEKLPRELPQLSDTENTSPAIGPRNANSVVEESYDIPRSHQLPYYNMSHLLERVISPNTNPIAASTPNLMSCVESTTGAAAAAAHHAMGAKNMLHRGLSSASATSTDTGGNTPASVRTLPRPHCYTNAAPSKVEGNVFRYDFIEQTDLPPVNRKLKPKVNIEDKPPEEFPAKPPIQAATEPASPKALEQLSNKLHCTQIQNASGHAESASLKPPSVDRKCKPNAYKTGSSATLSPATRRSTGAPLSMLLPHDTDIVAAACGHVKETHTLPRQPRPNYATGTADPNSPGVTVQHQRTASAAAAMQLTSAAIQSAQQKASPQQIAPPKQNEHKLQYFDLDVANKPPLYRQSMSVGNLNVPGTSRLGMPADPAAPIKSSVVYNLVDFVKTEAFKRIREERKKESEGINNANK